MLYQLLLRQAQFQLAHPRPHFFGRVTLPAQHWKPDPSQCLAFGLCHQLLMRNNCESPQAAYNVGAPFPYTIWKPFSAPKHLLSRPGQFFCS